jgi:ABC-type sugar transport system ATPase subunit
MLMPLPLEGQLNQAPQSDRIPLLSLHHISTATGLNDVNFSLFHKEVLGLYDINCTSDSFLIDALNAREVCFGSICLDQITFEMNNSIFKGSKYIGIITEKNSDFSLFENMNIEDNVTLMLPNNLYFPLGLINMRVKKYLFRKSLSNIHSDDILALADSNHGNELPYLEKQMKFRILVARYICSGVKVLVILDPQYSFDALNISEFENLLEDLLAINISVIIISSDLSFLIGTCMRIVTIQDGYINEESPSAGTAAKV